MLSLSDLELLSGEIGVVGRKLDVKIFWCRNARESEGIPMVVLDSL